MTKETIIREQYIDKAYYYIGNNKFSFKKYIDGDIDITILDNSEKRVIKDCDKIATYRKVSIVELRCEEDAVFYHCDNAKLTIYDYEDNTYVFRFNKPFKENWVRYPIGERRN